MGYFDDAERTWFKVPSLFSEAPLLEFGPSVFQHAARDSWRFGLGELRSAAATVNPVDWWRGGTGAWRTYQQGGLGAVGSALLDGLNPFNKKDYFAAGQSFMNLTLTAAPALGLVPATKLPILGRAIDSAMSAIPFVEEPLLIRTRMLGGCDPLTGEIAVRPRAAFATEERSMATIRHEQVHSFNVTWLPTQLRPTYASLYRRSGAVRWLEEYSAASRALGIAEGLRFPVSRRYTTPTRLFGEVSLYEANRALAAFEPSLHRRPEEDLWARSLGGW